MVFDAESEAGRRKAKMLQAEYIQYIAEKSLLEETMIDVALDFQSENLDSGWPPATEINSEITFWAIFTQVIGTKCWIFFATHFQIFI